jgi:tetratricopeptide (TPR) repeat protein
MFLKYFFILFWVLSSAVVRAGESEWKALNDQVMPQLQSGAFKQAEQLARDSVVEAENSFGAAHQNTAVSLSNLALVLRLQKRFGESEQHYRRALAIRDKSLGAAHPVTALTMLNLADVLQAQKKYAEAEKLQRIVLPLFEKLHGDDPKTATALNNLGANLQSQSRHKDAEPYLRRALAMKEKTLGPMNQSVAHTLNNLAEACESLGLKEEAAKHRARAAEILKQASARV